jgi:hypothetical protein
MESRTVTKLSEELDGYMPVVEELATAIYDDITTAMLQNYIPIEDAIDCRDLAVLVGILKGGAATTAFRFESVNDYREFDAESSSFSPAVLRVRARHKRAEEPFVPMAFSGIRAIDLRLRLAVHERPVRPAYALASMLALLRFGARPDCPEPSYCCLLHSVAIKGDPLAAKALLEAGADPDIRSDCFDTPLSFAAQSGSYKVAELLIAYGANVHLDNSKSMRPLDYAKARADADLVRLLEDASNVTYVIGPASRKRMAQDRHSEDAVDENLGE